MILILKSAFGRICLLNEMAPQYDVIEEALGQVLGLFIAITSFPQITVDRLPVALNQQVNQGVIFTLIFILPYRLDQRPVGSKEPPLHPAHIGEVIRFHEPYPFIRRAISSCIVTIYQ